MAGFWREKGNKLLGAMMVGLTSMGGGLWLANLKAVKTAIANERMAATVLLGVFLLLFAAGFPAGWLAGKRFEESPLLVWVSRGWGLPDPCGELACWFGIGVACMVGSGLRCFGFCWELGRVRIRGTLGTTEPAVILTVAGVSMLSGVNEHVR